MQKEKLIILIPFMNRYENLDVFLYYMHNFMKKNFSNINYEINVIEQINNKAFNKGILFNVGFLLTNENCDYYCLHDVDQIPISADYSYSNNVFHLCVNCIEQSNTGEFINFYKNSNFQQRGGAIIINKENYLLVNGHSNKYWGWGCIDDDFSLRLIKSKLNLYRKMNIKDNDNGYYISLKALTKRFNEDENYKKNFEYVNKMLKDEVNWLEEGYNDIINNNIKFDILEDEQYLNMCRKIKIIF